MKLAINGGTPVRERENFFPSQETIGEEEKNAVMDVMNDGILSHYRGNYIPAFRGGPQVKAFEREWCEKFRTEYAIAVNSCTSALQIACGAVGIEPGDEVIVTPWSMSCSATAPMVWGGVPVFADIDYNTFNLTVETVKDKITKRTKAIIAVDLFGCSIDPALRKFCDEKGIFLIEDAAQAPGAMSEGIYAGNIGHIGCLSFTQGKHMTSGEGGLLSTNDSTLARKCQLIRNHAESVISASVGSNENWFGWNNMLGFNLRMTEIQAAIMRQQLQKLDKFIRIRRENALALYRGIANSTALPITTPQPTSYDQFHAFYVCPFYWDKKRAEGIHRDKYLEAVRAELSFENKRIDRGIPIGGGYIQPLYRMPLFQNRMHWSIKKDGKYYSNLPTVEKLWKDDFFLTLYHGLSLSPKDRNDVITAFHKVWENREELR